MIAILVVNDEKICKSIKQLFGYLGYGIRQRENESCRYERFLN